MRQLKGLFFSFSSSSQFLFISKTTQGSHLELGQAVPSPLMSAQLSWGSLTSNNYDTSWTFSLSGYIMENDLIDNML